ncbi:hypothetical protein FDB50_17565 [Clostridium botulinum]|uniref:Uncharacterized protein n=1 Tax=Clostridium botulinum TaxID=1491 RepID=A0A846JZT9_CLOBO|nr:hypothetical protein [Clostridium botulinum]NFN06501.1 hypothetical protein [Clostridium botulinum]NFN20063.1 hypothetical protein [Clostridium botulinum]NFN36885.1 hypothetical protein [Clostridium botulinum]
MGRINSNLFNLDLNGSTDNNDEIINFMDEKIDIEEIYKNYSKILSSESKTLREKVCIHNIEFKIIEVTKENFSKNQYEILKHHNIALDIKDNTYSFITPDGIIYKILDSDLVSIVMNTPRPRKITYDLPGLTSSVYSMQLLANILENIKSSTIAELITSYGYKYTDDATALNLFINIFSIYEKIIYKYQYNNYINKENKIYNIFQNICYEIYNEKYPEIITNIDKNIFELCQKLKIDNICNYEVLDFLKYIVTLENNDLIYPSLNLELLDSINLTDFSNLIKLLSEKNFIENVNNNTLLHDTYHNGVIKSIGPLITPYTNKVVVSGSYKLLFQSIIVELLNNKKYIEYINDNKNIISEILTSKNISFKKNTIILLEWTLFAYINGCKTVQDYKLYFLSEKNTILCDDDISTLIDILNNNLHELIELIDDASSKNFENNNLIVHENLTAFNKSILNIQRKLIKTLISEVFDYIADFNRKNKFKIHFLGYNNYTIYLECEEGSLSVALDTLTRTMVTVYDKYLKKTKASCLVETLNI